MPLHLAREILTNPLSPYRWKYPKTTTEIQYIRENAFSEPKSNMRGGSANPMDVVSTVVASFFVYVVRKVDTELRPSHFKAVKRHLPSLSPPVT